MVTSAPSSILIEASRIFIALGLGALIGLERERSESGGIFAGSRTFPLFALYGALIQKFFPQSLPIAFGILIVPLSIAYLAKILIENDIGLTTLITALLTVVLGAMVTYSDEGAIIAVVLGGIITALLSAKTPIHDFIEKISEKEKYAAIKFVIVIFVIFPLLPNKEVELLFGLNPQFIWLMVVFVTGLSFTAYLFGKLLGTEKGLFITGILGGFISSTATTASMAGRTKELPNLYQIAAISTIIACIVMFPRALVEVIAINSNLLPHLLLPIVTLTIIGSIGVLITYYKISFDEIVKPEIRNPLKLKIALLFGLIFAIVLLASRKANSLFGASGIYLTAIISGMADVDAITLTLSKISSEGAITEELAAKGIIVAAISNTMVKASLAWILGTKKLGKMVTLILGITSIIGLLFVFLI